MPSCARCFGHGPDNSNHTYFKTNSDSAHTTYKAPSPGDVEYQLPSAKGTLNTKLHQDIQAKWDVTKDDVLNNYTYNKYSAYHWFGTNALLQNGLVWNFVRGIFNRRIDTDTHGVYDQIGSHENGIVLYRSNQAPDMLKARRYDWALLTTFGLWMSNMNTLMVLPFVYLCCSVPRRWSSVQHFTFHAELLPHTEQVVFHKASPFGELVRVFVDIKNLEKIDAEDCGVPLIWDINFYDSHMCFRCTESGQKFIFDKNGIWN